MLNDNDFRNRITFYIDDDLTSNEKKEFEETMKLNDDLKDLYVQIHVSIYKRTEQQK